MQWKNATLVQYAKDKIFAIGLAESKLHIFNLDLKVLKVVDYEFKDEISVLVASDYYAATGDGSGNVTVFKHNGDLALVR